MSVRDLSDFLRHRDPTLFAKLQAGRQSDGIRLLNQVTGLRVSEMENADSACAKFLKALKGPPMAVTNSYEDSYAREDYARKMMQMQQNAAMQGLGGYLQQAAQAQTPQPIPNPEPNKVLLLLGEDG